MIKIDDPIRCSCLFRLPNDISDQGRQGSEQIKEAICAKSGFLIGAGQTKQTGLTYGMLFLCTGNIAGRRRWRVVQKQAGEILITEVPDGGKKTLCASFRATKKSSPDVGLSGLCYGILDITPPSLPLSLGSLPGAREPYLAE